MKIYENNQEVFDAVWKHIGEQRKGCFAPGGSCLYFNPEDGTSCAIGGILPPEVDRNTLDRMSDSSIRYLMSSENPEAKKVKEVFKNVNWDLLVALQAAHDIQLRYGFLGWEAKMRSIAAECSLKVPNVE